MSRDHLSVLVGVASAAFFTAPAVQAAGLRGLLVALLGVPAAWALHRAGADLVGPARCWGVVVGVGLVVTELLVAGAPGLAGGAALLAVAALLGGVVALVLEQVEGWLLT